MNIPVSYIQQDNGSGESDLNVAKELDFTIPDLSSLTSIESFVVVAPSVANDDNTTAINGDNDTIVSHDADALDMETRDSILGIASSSTGAETIAQDATRLRRNVQTE